MMLSVAIEHVFLALRAAESSSSPSVQASCSTSTALEGPSSSSTSTALVGPASPPAFSDSEKSAFAAAFPVSDESIPSPTFSSSDETPSSSSPAASAGVAATTACAVAIAQAPSLISSTPARPLSTCTSTGSVLAAPSCTAGVSPTAVAALRRPGLFARGISGASPPSPASGTASPGAVFLPLVVRFVPVVCCTDFFSSSIPTSLSANQQQPKHVRFDVTRASQDVTGRTMPLLPALSFKIAR